MAIKIDNIDVDGVQHPISEFSAEVKSLVAMREFWAEDLERSERDAIKTKVAISQLDTQLSGLVKKELEAKAAPADEAANDSVEAADAAPTA